jgi:DNA-binding XRE family transcriptional regulator
MTELPSELPMNPAKQKKLEKAGFRGGSVQDFLNLAPGEMALIDMKIRLIGILKAARAESGVTQHRLARLIGSSQSRIAKVEAADPNVSLDLICKALFALGVSREKIGRTVAARRAA